MRKPGIQNIFEKSMIMVLGVVLVLAASFAIFHHANSPSVAQQKIDTPSKITNEMPAPAAAAEPEKISSNLNVPKENPSTKVKIPRHRSTRRIASVENTEPAEAHEKTASSPALVIQNHDEVKHSLLLSAGYQFTTLDAKDKGSTSSASLQTTSDLQVAAQWSQHWTDSTYTFQSASFRDVAFKASTNPNRSLADTQKTLPELSLGLGSDFFDKRLDLKFSVAYGDQLFLRGLTTNSVSVDTVNLGSATIHLEYEIFKKSESSLGLLGAYSYLASGTNDNYSISAGSAYQVGMVFNSKMAHKVVSLELGYQSRSQDTSLVRLKEDNIFGTLKFAIPIFEGGGSK